MKKEFASIIALFLFAASAVRADRDAWGDHADPNWEANGSPLTIATAGQLAAFAAAVNGGNNFEGVAINVATNHIDLSAHDWIPAGSGDWDCRFAGTFNGNGVVIDGMIVTTLNVDSYADGDGGSYDIGYAGLFGFIDYGSVVNGIILTNSAINVAIDGILYVGGIAGCNNGNIANCENNGDISADCGYASNYAGAYAGGIAGGNAGKIERCENNAAINLASIGDWNIAHAGGIAGANGYDSGSKIASCANRGAVSAATSGYGQAQARVGGIVGENGGVAEDCENSGDVGASTEDADAYVGGIAGFNCSYMSVIGCENIGAVSVAGDNFVCVGGIVGENWQATVANCANRGSVAAAAFNANAGGIAGINGGTLVNCENRGDVATDSQDFNSYARSGGIAGYNFDYNFDKYALIANCVNHGGIAAANVYVANSGGIAGQNDSGSIVENCYWLDGMDMVSVVGAGFGATNNCASFGAAPGAFSGDVAVGGSATNDLLAALNLWVAANAAAPAAPCAFWAGDSAPDSDGYPRLTADIPVRVTFSGNGGAPDFVAMQTLGAFYDLPAPDHGIVLSDGYSFGWHTAEAGGKEVTAATRVADHAPHTLHARVSSNWAHAAFRDAGWNTNGAALAISTAAQLAQFAYLVNEGCGFEGVAIGIAASRIDLSAHDWTPAGAGRDNAFNGAFNGNGAVIDGMKIAAPNVVDYFYDFGGDEVYSYSEAHAGLFGAIGYEGAVDGVALTNSAINIAFDGEYLYAGGVAGENFGAIANCASHGEIFAVSRSVRIGGIAGENDNTISNCVNRGAVNAVSTGNWGALRVGGIAGENWYGEIVNCENRGSVAATAGAAIYATGNAGGISGVNNYALAAGCANYGDISASAAYIRVGGISGDNNDDSSVVDCDNFGNVAASASGGDRLAESALAGGIAGHNNAEIARCGNFGAVAADAVADAGEACAGGIAGANSSDGTLSDCENHGGASAGPNAARANAGGAAGYNYGELARCANHGEVSASVAVFGEFDSGKAGFAHAGGIAGQSSGGATGCENNGNVSAAAVADDQWSYASANAGGIVGGNSGDIFHCANNGGVAVEIDESQTSANGGGIAGISYGSIANCENRGGVAADAVSDARAGGIAGENHGVIANCDNRGGAGAAAVERAYAGGIAGISGWHSAVANCANHGGAAAAAFNAISIGGVIGENWGGAVENCYWLIGAGAFSAIGDGYGAAIDCPYFGDAPGVLSAAVEIGGDATTDLLDALNAWVRANAAAAAPLAPCALWAVDPADGYPRLAADVPVYVTFSGNGDAPGATVLQMLGKFYSLPAPDPSVIIPGGYAFGWHTAEVGGTEITAATRVSNHAPHTLYARLSSNWAHSAFRDASWNADGAALEISTAAQLAQFAYLVNAGNSFEGVAINIATNYLDLSAHDWMPVGDYGNLFRGVLNGNGAVIDGMVIATAAANADNRGFAGLFGAIGAGCVVNGVTLTNTAINVTHDGPLYIGGIAGCNVVGDITGHNVGVIANCANYGSVAGTVTGRYNYIHLGGIIGHSGWELTVADCENHGDIAASSSSASVDVHAAGIAGYASGNVSIINCENRGNVAATSTGDWGYAYAGGIAGDNDSAIANCANLGAIAAAAATYACAGGIAGCNYGSIANCANYGGATAAVGDWNDAYLGAIVGDNEYGAIANCYWLGGIGVEAATEANAGTIADSPSFGAAPGALAYAVAIDGIAATDLLTALNAWVAAPAFAAPAYRGWIPEGGDSAAYPVLGSSAAGIPIYIPQNGNLADLPSALEHPRIILPRGGVYHPATGRVLDPDGNTVLYPGQTGVKITKIDVLGETVLLSFGRPENPAQLCGAVLLGKETLSDDWRCLHVSVQSATSHAASAPSFFFTGLSVE